MPVMVTCKECGVECRAGVQVQSNEDFEELNDDSSDRIQCPKGHVHSYGKKELRFVYPWQP